MTRAALAVRWSCWLARTLAIVMLPPCLALAQPSAEHAPDRTTQHILALENLGRAQPTEAAAQLEQMLGATAEFSAQRLELLTVQGVMLADTTPPEAAERSATRLDAWSQAPGLLTAPGAAAAAQLIRARSLGYSGNLPQAAAMLQEAYARLPPAMPPRERYRFALALGYIKFQAGKLEDAVRLYHEALALADRQDDLWRRSEARILLANGYFGAGQIERAQALTHEAQALAEKAGDGVSLGRVHTMAAMIFDGLKDLQGERRSLELAIENAHRAGSKTEEALYLANMADFFLQNADYKTALAHAERALPLTREQKDIASEALALGNIGMAHISLHHLELGTRYVREAMAIDSGRGAITRVSDTFRELGVYLEKAGDPAAAVAAYHQHRRLAAGILRDDRRKAILAMQEQYDADGRTRALALLNRESEIKAAQLHRRDLQQRMWWLLAAAFALLFSVVTMQYRHVRRTNRLLSTSNKRLKVQSERDPLTGLANRRHFQAVMHELANDGKLSGTVYLIDIDHFKNINDRYGHGAGDAVLVEVARRLRETLREHDLIVRWGGEEFLVVVQALAPDMVDTLAQRMLSALDRAPVIVDTHRIAVTGSIGFATFPIGPAPLRVSLERAINLVDTAMYLAKAHGRNRAYGVRILRACDEAALEAITGSLESASRDGQVTLTLLQGGAALAAA